MMRLEHIGIAVANPEKSSDLFDRLLGSKVYKEETVGSEKVTTYFYDVATAKLELLAASSEVCFLHPKSTHGVLIELCQTVGENQNFNPEQ